PERELSLRVRTGPVRAARLAQLRVPLEQLMRVDDRRGHEGIGLVRRIAEHEALIPCPLLLGCRTVDALRDVARLLAERVDDRARSTGEATVRVAVPSQG